MHGRRVARTEGHDGDLPSRVMASDSTPQPTPDDAAGVRDYSGASALTDQARWVIEAHYNRAEGLQQRAMGFLGVIGVMLGLVLTALTIGTAPQHVIVQVFTVLTLVVLLASGVEFVRCLWVASVSLPSASQLRERWSDYTERTIGDNRARVLIANDFLGSSSAGTTDPLTSARAAADLRAKLLKSGLQILVVAFVLLSALIVSIVFSHGGR